MPTTSCWCVMMAAPQFSVQFAKPGLRMSTQFRTIVMLGGLFLATPVWSAATLAEALDQAWERAVSARVAEARRSQAEASRSVADGLFPRAPSLGMSQRDDRFNRNRGLRERELELALPLWLPGQREARRLLAEREMADGEAAIAAARLALAGDVRTAVWSLASAQAELAIARERVVLAEQLEADVTKREAVGELARTDLLLAREDLLTAKVALANSRTRERQTLERYRFLTGSDTLPTRIEETVTQATDTRHPRMRLAEAGIERARAEMQFVRESRRDAPELAISWQQSREDVGALASNSIRFGFRIPLATDARNAPRIASVNADLIRAEAEYRQTVGELEADQREAAALLDNSRLAMEAAEQRSALAGERLRHLDRAFSLGELSLIELVRVRGAANEARLEAMRARHTHAAARARFNQAQGILP